MEAFLIGFGFFFSTVAWLAFLANAKEETIQTVIDWAKGKR